MTDRLHSLTVVLDKVRRDDDAEDIIEAIRMIKGVASVEGNVADPSFYAATEQAKFQLRQEMRDVLWPRPKRG